ncbi:MAG: hypothetical protein ACI8UO_004611 [Verrucomicrobiales bacterium]|jgi:hypothetical protein
MSQYQTYTIERFADDLENRFERSFGQLGSAYKGFINWSARMALDRIGSSDMLYHNVDHTMMVTIAGQEILTGKQISDSGLTPKDWVEFTVATLCHDIGYVRGVCSDDEENEFVTQVGEPKITLGPDTTDAMLTPHHVDRGKVFVCERFGNNSLLDISAERMAEFIEYTRFPPTKSETKTSFKELPDLVRAADLIGQLGDPGYLRKIPALYYEFEQLGMNEKLGYTNPGQMRENYGNFFWGMVYPYIKDAITYLEATERGRQWIATLFSHVFTIEHADEHGAPKPTCSNPSK